MAVINGLNHVGIKVKDVETSARFYMDVLDFKMIWSGDITEQDGSVTKVVFVRNGSLTLELIQVAGYSERTSYGVVEHIAMDVDDIEASKSALLAKGVVFDTDIITLDHVCGNGCRYILFKGPDKEILELNELL